jgi:hypothetical protein
LNDAVIGGFTIERGSRERLGALLLGVYAGSDLVYIGHTGALEKCTKYTKALVEIGSNQDELVMECRLVVKSLRQRAALLMALDPKVSKIAKEIRAKTQEVLRNPAHHESYDK